MDSAEIKEILEKYWKGESTLEEERKLSRYLSTREGKAELPREAALFGYYDEKRADQMPVSDRELVQNLDRKAEKKASNISRFWTFAKVAAAIAVLAVAAFLVREDMRTNPATPEVVADTFEDPEKAFEETKKALELLSKKIGKGKSYAHSVGYFHDTKEKIENKIEKE